ncbi:putative UDP-glucose 6-dehydrogenase YtcA protein, partial [Marine Group I thaumarchaeote SCGC AAA799-E16]
MKIAVIGLGFVGLSLATVLGSKNYKVVGIDTDIKKIQKIENGIIPFSEPELQNILKLSLNKRLKISSDFEEINDCDFIFISVGTPQSTDGSIDLTNIKLVSKIIGKHIQNTIENFAKEVAKSLDD